ncbi:hypothetical protein H0H93_003614, partial [Arthromyces matolae]
MDQQLQPIPDKGTSDYTKMFLRILDLEIQAYLGRKMNRRASAASTPADAELRPINFVPQ